MSVSLKAYAPVAPPMESVTILPLAWHCLMPASRKLQFGSWLPGKTGLSDGLQI